MNPGDAFEAGLPPPQADEPPALRRDIIDELADHLECSFRHELLRGCDPETARARALARFGDPAVVARRLWFDAMKGRIMKQRLLIGAGVVVVLASLVLTGLAWTAMARVQLESARALAASQAANKQMLARLSEMAESLKHPSSPGWNPVKVVVVDEQPDGPPVEGVRILMARSGSTSAEQQWRETTDSQGNADFGLHQPGSYNLSIERSTPEGTVSGFQMLNVKAGTEAVKRIACPRPPRKKAAVKVTCQWPREFEKAGLYLYVPFVLSARNLPADDGDGQPDSWTLHLPLPEGSIPRRFGGPMGPPITEKEEFQAYLFGTDGSTTEFRDGRAPFPWIQEDTSRDGSYLTPPRLLADVADAHRLPFDPARAKWAPWPYRVSILLVLKPIASKDVAPGRRRYEVVAGRSPAFQAAFVPNDFKIQAAPPNDAQLGQPLGLIMSGPSNWLNFSPIQSPPFDTPDGESRFVPSLDHPNEWAIPFPDELSKQLREMLKKPAEQTPKKP